MRSPLVRSFALAFVLGVLVLCTSLVARADGGANVHTSLDDVRACAMLPAGAALAGTTGGLAYYGADGALGWVATSLDGLPETRVHAILVEGERVWIGTERGLAEGRVGPSGLGVLRTFPSQLPVRAIHRHAGELYVGTWGGGVQRVSGAALVPLAPGASPASPAQRITALASFDGALHAATAGAGLYRVAGASVAPVNRPRIPTTLWSLAVHDGRLWAGGLEGAVSLPPDGAVRFENDADTRALAESGASLLLGTFGKGLLRVADRAALPETVASVFVQAIDVSPGPAGGRCLGTPSGLVLPGARAQVHTGGLADNDVTAVARDGADLWIGTYEHGVFVRDERGAWRHVHHVDGRVNAMTAERTPGASHARIWIGTARGLTMIDGETARTFGGGGVLPSSTVHALTTLSGGGVLVGTERGAALIKDGVVTRIDEKQGLPLRAVWAVAEAPGGVLLLGTSAGLYAGVLGGPWQRASIAGGQLEDDWVTALVVNAPDVYVGTYNSGVTRLVLSGGALASGEHEHFAGGYVNPAGLAIARGQLFAATMDGLLVRPLTAAGTNSTATTSTSTSTRGWTTLRRASTGRDVTAVLPFDDQLWVGSRRGLVRTRL